MYLVEIRRHGAELGVAMAQMRAWLDHRHLEPSLFELAFLPEREMRFRVQFQDAGDASAFAGVFDGEMVSQPATALAA